MFSFNKILNRKNEQGRSPTRSDSVISKASGEVLAGNAAEGFLCPSCFSAFPTAELLQNHYESSHSEGIAGVAVDGRNSFNCPACKMKLGSDIELQSHYKRHHATPKAQGEIDALQMQVQALMEGKSLLQTELQTIRPQLLEQFKESTKVREERDALELKAAKLAGELADLKANHDETLSRKLSLESYVKEAESKMAKLEIEIQRRPEADDVNLLQQEIVSVQKMMDQLTLQREAEKETLELQCSSLKETCSRLESEKSILENCINGAPRADDFQSLQAKVSEMSLQISQLHESLHHKDREKAELEDILQKYNDYDELKIQLQEKEGLLQEVSRTTQERDDHIEKLKADLKAEKDAIEQMKLGRDKLFSKIEEGEGASAAMLQLKEENARIQEQFLQQQVLNAETIQDMQAKLEELRLNLRKVKSELQSTAQKNEELKNKLSSSKSELQSLSSEKENLVNQLNIQRDNFSKKESTSNFRLQSLENELKSMKKALDEKTTQLPIIQQEIKLLKESSTKEKTLMTDENKKLKAQVNDLSNELSSSKEEMIAKVNRTSVLERKLEELSAELKKEKEKTLESANQLLAVQTSLEDVTVKLKNMENEVSGYDILKIEYSEKLQTAAEELLKSQENVAELSSALDNMNEVKAQLSDKVMRFDKETSELKTSIEHLTVEKCYLQNTLEDVNEKFANATELCKNQETKLTDLQELYDVEKDNREKDVQDLENTKQLLINQKVALNKEMAEIKEESEKKIAALEDNLKEMDQQARNVKMNHDFLATNLKETVSASEQKKQEWEKSEAHYQAQVGVLTENSRTLREDLQAEQNRREILEQKFDELSGNKLELEAKLENALDERRALLDRCLKSEAESEKLLKSSTDLRRKLDDSVAALHELGRENQTLQVENVKHIARKWADDGEVTHCTACGKLFTVTVRKHHCRNCGNIFCNECSARSAAVASSKKPVRVCDVCFAEISK